MVIRSLRHEESGFTLIEILMSALLVAVISIGVLKGFDVSSAASARNKGRGIAAGLAQQDQERMRAMTATNLAGVNSTRNVSVCGNGTSGCVTYHVASKADWVADTSASSSCTLSSARSYNLQITSTVTWDNQGSASNVVEKSLVSAPPGTSGGGQGSLAVRIREVDGVTAVPGIVVTLTPPSGSPQTATTDANGCIVWDYLNSGTGYTISFNNPSYWDPSGQHAVSRSIAVVGQRLTTQNFTYSPGDTVDFSFKAYAGNGVLYPAQADRVTIERSGYANQVIGTSGTMASKIRVRNLPPASNYYAWAGECAGEKITTFPGPFYPNLGNLTGGALWNVSVNLIGIRDLFYNSNSITYTGTAVPHARFTEKTAGCPGTVYNAYPTSGSGYIQGFGVPKGTYDVCTEAYIASRGRYYHQVYSNQVISTTSTLGQDISGTWNITSGDLSGPCP